MKFTIVNIDKQSPQGKQRSLKERTHVTLRTAESFIEKIKTDTKARHIGRYRSHHSQHGGDVELYLRQHPLPKVYPCAEFSKDDTGALHFQKLTGVIPLCVPHLFSAENISNVKRVAASLPTTLAAFLDHVHRHVADGNAQLLQARSCPVHQSYSYSYEQTIIDNTLLPDAQRLLAQAQNQLATTPEDQPGYAGLYQAITQLASVINSSPSSASLAAAMANLTQAMANARGSW